MRHLYYPRGKIIIDFNTREIHSFLNTERLAIGRCRSFCDLVGKLWISALFTKSSLLVDTKVIREYIYWDLRGRMPNCLKRLRHEVLLLMFIIILIILFCILNIILMNG